MSKKDRKRGGNGLQTAGTILKVILVLLVAALVIFAVVSVIKKQKGTLETKPAQTEAQTEETPESQAEPQDTLLSTEAYPEIQALVENYFTALHNCDQETLSRIVASTASITTEQLQTEAQFVENYQNIVCHTTKGVVDGTYISYVCYDLKLINIQTPAPCMIRLYVCTNGSGDLYIYNENTYDESTAAYMDQLNNSEEVSSLMKSVDDALVAARSQDNDLNSFVAMLNGENVDPAETTAAETQASSGDFTAVDETVYAKENVKMHVAPEADSDSPGTLWAGEKVHRTGYNDNWSRVEYSGETYYIAAGYLTQKEPEEKTEGGFISVTEKVYAKESVRIRKSTSTDSEEIGYLQAGDSVKRTGYNDNWSRVEYNGKTGYIKAGYLTEQAPE